MQQLTCASAVVVLWGVVVGAARAEEITVNSRCRSAIGDRARQARHDYLDRSGRLLRRHALPRRLGHRRRADHYQGR